MTRHGSTPSSASISSPSTTEPSPTWCPTRPAGGAELWQLRKEAYRKLKVQRQEPQEPDADGVRPIERQLMTAVAALRDERFPARPGSHCQHCEFVRLCPAKTSGTVLS